MALRGYLKSLILKALLEKSRSGYSLMNLIEEKTEHRPSAGSIYPLLEGMAEDNVLKWKERGNKKVYSLTVEGKKQAKEHVETVSRLLTEIKESVKLLAVLRETDMAHYIDTIEQDIKGKVPFGTLGPEVDKLREYLYLLNATGAMQRKSGQIRKILKKTNSELKRFI